MIAPGNRIQRSQPNTFAGLEGVPQASRHAKLCRREGRAYRVDALELCADIAARHKQQLIAVVYTAVELSASQRRRLAQALARSYGHDVHLDVVIDPSVVGGLSVQIGDELIDGTAASRLAAVRRKLAG